MKNLTECKEYYKDMYLNWYAERNNISSFWLDRMTTLQEALEFIYGDSFKRIERQWMNEALDEYYDNVAPTIRKVLSQ